MVGVTLPANVALTDRSRKFYEGTYKWDSDGFTDDIGVYRAFDCYDPAARAPTPLPCMFLDDEDEEVAIYENLKDSGKTFTFASDPKGEGELVVRCDALFRGLENREHLLGRMEGVLIASRANKIELSLDECYRFCGIPGSIVDFEKASMRGITPPSSPLKKKNDSTTTPKRSPPKPSTSSPVELSPCPSDISEWDENKQDAGASMAATRSDPAQQDEEEVIEEPRQKPAIRGVAQKVKKAAKKPAPKASKKKTKPSLVVALNMGSSMNLGSSMEGSRRRSTRLGGGK